MVVVYILVCAFPVVLLSVCDGVAVIGPNIGNTFYEG
jgi:hypothetical protein